MNAPVTKPFAAEKLTPEIMAVAKRHRALIEASFHVGPVFRVGHFDAHVRAWRKATQREVYRLYHTQPSFAVAYEAHRAQLRAMPMPGWGERPCR